MSKIALSGNASGTGTLTIAAPNTNSDRTIDLPDAAGTVFVSGQALSATTGSFSGALQSSGVATNIYPLVPGTNVASTSGSSISFTAIPSWVKRVVVVFNGVSMNSSGLVYMRLGTSAGNATSGYLGASIYINTTGSTLASSYWPLDGTSLGAGATRYATYTISNVTGNTWVMSGTTSNSNDTGISVTNGGIALSGVLDRVALETSAGAFDAGSINIFYE